MKMESSQVLNMNSIMYSQSMISHATTPSSSSSNTCSSFFNHTVSPKQKKLSSQKPRKVTKSKKIVLGKPCNGKYKMNLQELMALSRQIRPYSTSTTTSNAQAEQDTKNITLLGRNLREKLFKAKSKMMDNLKNSVEPQDVVIYENLVKTTLPSLVENSNNTISDDDEDDCSSVSTLSSIQLRLVTDASGRVSVVSDDFFSYTTTTTTTLHDDGYSNDNYHLFGHDSTCTSIMPLYTPFLPANTDLYLQQHSWYQDDINNDVTEDQINSWLQRGGHDDSINSPITMATDQELADLLEFGDM